MYSSGRYWVVGVLGWASLVRRPTLIGVALARSPHPSKMPSPPSVSPGNGSSTLHVITVNVVGLTGISVDTSKQVNDGSGSSAPPPPPKQMKAVVAVMRDLQTHSITTTSKGLVLSAAMEQRSQMTNHQKFVAVWDDKSKNVTKPAASFEAHIPKDNRAGARSIPHRNFELIVGLTTDSSSKAIPIGAASLPIAEAARLSGSNGKVLLDLPVYNFASLTMDPFVKQTLDKPVSQPVPLPKKSRRRLSFARRKKGGEEDSVKEEDFATDSVVNQQQKMNALGYNYFMDPTRDAAVLRVELELHEKESNVEMGLVMKAGKKKPRVVLLHTQEEAIETTHTVATPKRRNDTLKDILSMEPSIERVLSTATEDDEVDQERARPKKATNGAPEQKREQPPPTPSAPPPSQQKQYRVRIVDQTTLDYEMMPMTDKDAISFEEKQSNPKDDAGKVLVSDGAIERILSIRENFPVFGAAFDTAAETDAKKVSPASPISRGRDPSVERPLKDAEPPSRPASSQTTPRKPSLSKKTSSPGSVSSRKDDTLYDDDSGNHHVSIKLARNSNPTTNTPLFPGFFHSSSSEVVGAHTKSGSVAKSASAEAPPKPLSPKRGQSPKLAPSPKPAQSPNKLVQTPKKLAPSPPKTPKSVGQTKSGLKPPPSTGSISSWRKSRGNSSPTKESSVKKPALTPVPSSSVPNPSKQNISDGRRNDKPTRALKEAASPLRKPAPAQAPTTPAPMTPVVQPQRKRTSSSGKRSDKTKQAPKEATSSPPPPKPKTTSERIHHPTSPVGLMMQNFQGRDSETSKQHEAPVITVIENSPRFKTRVASKSTQEASSPDSPYSNLLPKFTSGSIKYDDTDSSIWTEDPSYMQETRSCRQPNRVGAVARRLFGSMSLEPCAAKLDGVDDEEDFTVGSWTQGDEGTYFTAKTRGETLVDDLADLGLLVGQICQQRGLGRVVDFDDDETATAASYVRGRSGGPPAIPSSSRRESKGQPLKPRWMAGLHSKAADSFGETNFRGFGADEGAATEEETPSYNSYGSMTFTDPGSGFHDGTIGTAEGTEVDIEAITIGSRDVISTGTAPTINEPSKVAAKPKASHGVKEIEDVLISDTSSSGSNDEPVFKPGSLMGPASTSADKTRKSAATDDDSPKNVMNAPTSDPDPGAKSLAQSLVDMVANAINPTPDPAEALNGYTVPSVLEADFEDGSVGDLTATTLEMQVEMAEFRKQLDNLQREARESNGAFQMSEFTAAAEAAMAKQQAKKGEGGGPRFV